MKHLLTLLACLPFAASAQTADISCLPQPLGDPAYASPLHIRYADGKGFRIHWTCWSSDDVAVPGRTFTYYILTSELSKVGGRLATILSADDPLKSAQTAEKRFPVIPLTDPAFETTFRELLEALK